MMKEITVLDCENEKKKIKLARCARSLAQYNSGGDPFFGWGGGGAKVLKWQKISEYLILRV